MTGRDGLEKVIEGIRAAREMGFHPVKVNAVIIRDINDEEIEALAEFARKERLSLRFIEFMPLDSARAWQKEMVVTGPRCWGGFNGDSICGRPERRAPPQRRSAGCSPTARAKSE